jgi:Kdo2-lipid IVA lauroyltransferase/acyltransferase
VSPAATYWIKDPLWGAVDYATHYGLRLLPARAVSDIGQSLGALAGRHRFAHLSARAERNLQHIRPDLSAQARAAMVAHMWQQLGRTIAEMSTLERLFRSADITIENEALLREHARGGRPVIFVFAHLGNWEMLAAAIRRAGFTLNVVYEHLRNRFQRQLAAQARRRLGYRLITPDRAGVREMLAALGRGEAIGLAIDEHRAGNVLAPAFGRPIPAHANLHYAERLATKFNATLLPCYCVRRSALAFELHFLAPIPAQDAAARVNTLCEAWIRAQPEQWYMLHRLHLP